MNRAALSSVPTDSDWLCEGCGYVLKGLPDGGRCPECGKPLCESAGDLRVVPAWERPETGPAVGRFLGTSAEILFRPTRFYRSLATRGGRRGSRRFAAIHSAIASILLGLAAWVHFDWFWGLVPGRPIGTFVPWPVCLALIIATFLTLVFVTHVAAQLTAWEAGYRGLRLPREVVLRGLDYHAVHYVPVALVAALTVLGYRLALRSASTLAAGWAVPYLYTLCGEVVLAAGYLFKTYWIAMRNIMYASR